MKNQRMWLAWMAATVVAAGSFAGMAEDKPAPEKNPPRRMQHGDEMERMKDSPEFQAMRARRQEIRQAMEQYRKLDDAKKPEAEAKIKAMLKADLETALQQAKERLAENRERLEKMQAELDKRAANLDAAVNEQFQRMKDGKRPEGPGMGPRDGKGPKGKGRGKGAGERAPKPAPEQAPEATPAK